MPEFFPQKIPYFSFFGKNMTTCTRDRAVYMMGQALVENRFFKFYFWRAVFEILIQGRYLLLNFVQFSTNTSKQTTSFKTFQDFTSNIWPFPGIFLVKRYPLPEFFLEKYTLKHGTYLFSPICEYLSPGFGINGSRNDSQQKSAKFNDWNLQVY